MPKIHTRISLQKKRKKMIIKKASIYKCISLRLTGFGDAIYGTG